MLFYYNIIMLFYCSIIIYIKAILLQYYHIYESYIFYCSIIMFYESYFTVILSCYFTAVLFIMLFYCSIIMFMKGILL